MKQANIRLLSYLAQLSSGGKMFQTTKPVAKIKTHILCAVSFFS